MKLLLKTIHRLVQYKVPNSTLGFNTSLPHISVIDYIKRIVHHGSLGKDVLDITALYLVRLSQTLSLHVGNIHRLLGVLLLIAAKMENDDHYTNKYWSKLLGIPLHEVNHLEKELLIELQYNLYPFATHREMLALIQ